MDVIPGLFVQRQLVEFPSSKGIFFKDTSKIEIYRKYSRIPVPGAIVRLIKGRDLYKIPFIKSLSAAIFTL